VVVKAMKIYLIIVEREQGMVDPPTAPSPAQKQDLCTPASVHKSLPKVVVRGMKIYLILVEWVREG
jgi:hypothetical protein